MWFVLSWMVREEVWCEPSGCPGCQGSASISNVTPETRQTRGSVDISALNMLLTDPGASDPRV